MKYKLIRELNNDNSSNVIESFFKNRSISDYKEYIALDDSYINHYSLLSNIDLAVQCLLRHIEKNSNIVVVTDPDGDGLTSAAILYSYLSKIYDKSKIQYILHTGKQHGLSRDISIPDNTGLVILPDSGTNDSEQCKKLKERNIDVLVLDHHEKSNENPYAIIVNNQLCQYPNKQLSGVGVVWQFLKALDDELWNDYADDYLDLVALGNIADSMDIRSYETKRLIDKGLANIKNKGFLAFIDKNSYSLGSDPINIINTQFYLIPSINGLLRIGTQEEKEILFKSFIETDETYPYTKRDKTEIQETVYERAARLAVNAKAKQNRQVDSVIDTLREKITKYKWDNNKILFCEGNEVDGNLSGLIAMKLASEYNRPCVILRDSFKPGFYGGSARNIDCEIDSLKDFLESTGYFTGLFGHSNAFGVDLPVSKRKEMIAKVNEMLADFSYEKVYKVDFVLEPDELELLLIQELDQLKPCYGNGIPESMIALVNVKINSKDIQLIGKESDTWKFTLNNDGVQVIKFKCDESDKILQIVKDSWQEQQIVLELVGRVGINCFNNIYTPQFVVSDYNILEVKEL
jgi:single-stranded-DNA-specific exonuclease